MSIYNIQNPPRIGGTAQFHMKSYRGSNVIDESLMVGILGFGGEIGTMTSTTVAVDSSSSVAAGDISKYIFSFRTDVFLPQNIYLKLQLPRDTFEVSKYPSCSSFPINGKIVAGVFACEYNDIQQAIEVRGIGQSIPKDSDVGVLVTMKNPKYSYTTSPFEMYVMKEGTTLAFTRKLEIKGMPITAGSITQISMYPLDPLYIISKKKIVWYSLNFKLRNPLNTGAMISVKLPSSIAFAPNPAVEGTEVVFYVKSGLNDIADDNPLSIYRTTVAGSTYLRIENFKSMDQPDLITINMLLVMPSSAGESSPFEIISYTSNLAKSEIDKDISTARVAVQEIDCPIVNSATSSVVFADGVSPTNLVFTLTPSKTLLGNGMFKVLIDERISALGVSSKLCSPRRELQGLQQKVEQLRAVAFVLQTRPRHLHQADQQRVHRRNKPELRDQRRRQEP